MSSRLMNFTAIIVAVFVSAMSLMLTKNIMIPFVISLFLAFILQPIVDFMTDRGRLGRGTALLLLCLLLIGGSTLLVLIISSSIRGLIDNSSSYEERLRTLLSYFLNLTKTLPFGIEFDQDLDGLFREIPVFGFVKSFSQGLLKWISNVFLISVFTLFILSGAKFELPQTLVWGKVNRSIRIYLVTKAVTSLTTGGLVGVFFLIIDLDMAIMFGILAFIFNFIPTIGSIIATLLPLPVAFLQYQSPLLIGLSLAIPGSIQFVIGNIIEPKLVGQNLDLHPVTILLSLMFWGFLWGVPGMLLATPITVIIKILMESRPLGKPFADLMAGRVNLD